METVTIQQAFKSWSMQKENITLAARNREAVRSVLMKRHQDLTLDRITPDIAREIFSKSKDRPELKTKAASTLVHLMNWGAERGYCQRPAFSYEIGSEGKKEKTKEVKPLVKVTVIPQDTDLDYKSGTEPETDIQTKNNMTMEKQQTRKGGRQPRKVCQLNAETLEVIASYDSIKEACEKNGIKKLNGALSKHQKAGGYYWCYAGQESTFVPLERQQKPQKPRKEKPTTAAASPSRTQTPSGKSLADYSDKEIIEEIRRREWKGSFSFVTTIEL